MRFLVFSVAGNAVPGMGIFYRHRARNVGLVAARGAFVGSLDADDLIAPNYLAVLRPLALAGGAAFGNVRVVADESGLEVQRAFPPGHAPARLGITALLDLTVPLLPLVAREYALPRLDGIEFGEDFVANLRLIAANWLSENILAFSLLLFAACLLLGLATALFLSRIGRRGSA